MIMEGAETVIIQELMEYRTYSRELVKALDKLWEDEDGCFEKRVMILEGRLTVMDSWLSMLDMYESFVLMRHLVAGRSWTQTANEYKRVFGGTEADENAACRIQARAIAKIVGFVCEDSMDSFWFSVFYKK